MKFAVLAAAESFYGRDLQRAAASRHEIKILPFSGIQATHAGRTIRIETGGCDLRNFDAVLVRTMPPGSLEQVVFRMDALARCESSGVPIINSPRSLEVAVDKYLASARLQEAGLLIPTTIACQTVEDALLAFENLGGDVVVKPLFGSEGRGITRVTDPEIALRAFKLLVQLGAVLYFQPFVPHLGYDLRLFVLGSRVFGMCRRNPHDWRTNVSRGAVTEPLQVTDELKELALRAASSVGATMAGVDVLPATDGQHYVLEVNAVPGWRALARTLNMDIAQLVLEYVSQRVAQKK